MRQKIHAHPTIGFLSTWSVYEGTTIDAYTHTLLQGIRAAARELSCNLLLGCGISLPGSPRASRTAWAAPGTGVDFIPVGPWNSAGLIVIPDDLSDVQFEYVQDLIRSGYPLVLTTAEKPGPIVAVDNASGIRQAFDHLLQHGHRRIAFIAGKSGRGGDSAERLAAYRQALREAHIEEDARLIAFGEHRREDGRLAMQRILASAAPFSAMLASNDLSALGAIDVLRESGRRIPDDVAVIGFDDILAARSQLPPLSSVRHPTFTQGYEAVLTLFDRITGKRNSEAHSRVATQLVIRQSCGCLPESAPVSTPAVSRHADLESVHIAYARAMAEATLVEARHSPYEEIERLCLDLIRAFTSSLKQADPTAFDAAMQQLFDWLETRGEDAHAWHAALSTLRRGLPNLLRVTSVAEPGFAETLIDRARLEIAEQAQRQTIDALLRQRETSNRLGLMTSQLLAALDTSESANILAQHLPQLGIPHAIVALYSAHDDDPFASSTILIDAGWPASAVGCQFTSREFPPLDLYSSDCAVQLAILPLVIDDHSIGFVAFSATNLEPCAAIVHNLASMLRTSRLYRAAIEGQQLAEKANRLKSRFLSMVSHELRTPLSLIVGLSEMVLREQHETSTTTLRDVEQINTSAQHLARLIGDVLDLASSEAGQLRILREPLDLAEVLRVAATIGEQLARDKGLSWRAQLPQHGPWVLGDRTRLRQVTLNLISNAVKFTSNGEVLLEVAVNDQHATISVSDSGIGIPANEQELIFHEFHRSERTIQSGYGGLGLGLTISKQLIEQHGGAIGVRSPGDLGSGSTFYLTLPIIAAKPIDLDVSNLPNAVVMVLSERANHADRLCAHLRESGFDVHVCQVEQETEWLPQVIASPPAVLIMEQPLAAREGWAIIAALKRQRSTEHIPVLAYALDLEHDRGEFIELNYLHKPLRPEQLAGELARHTVPDNAQRTILVVDDDPGIVELHSRLVEQSGCRAISARNGQAALEAIEHMRPDLILLDLMMPGMDGFAVLDALRMRESWRDIPVIVLTARLLSEADIERCNRGVSTILSKGLFNAAETLQHIETALARQHTLGRSTQRLVRHAMAYIHTHYAESLGREDIAAHVSISPDYLTDCFRQELGITPITYLSRYRIRQARELLENSDMMITQIALSVGFSEGAHFTRTFQREVGVTPRAYRRGKRAQIAT